MWKGKKNISGIEFAFCIGIQYERVHQCVESLQYCGVFHHSAAVFFYLTSHNILSGKDKSSKKKRKVFVLIRVMWKRKSTEFIDAPSPRKAPQPSTSGFRRCTKSFTNVEPEEAFEDYLFDSGSDEDVELDCGFSTTDSSEEECEESDEESTLSECTSRLVEPGIWSSVQPISPSIPFTGNPGLITSMASKEPIDFFFLLANDQLFDIVLRETNFQGHTLSRSVTCPNSRLKIFKQVKREELEVFLGLIFLAGNIRVPCFSHFWKKNDLYQFPAFANAMSRDRFQTILAALHFSRNPQKGQPKSSDPLYEIRPLLDHFTNTMREIYYPEKNLSLDESMLLHFRQYIKNKSHKYGIKFYMLTEPNGIVLRNIIYCGSRDPDIGGVGHTEKAIRTLLTDFLGKGHSVFFNNFYSSVALVRELLYDKTYATGILRANRKGNPLAVTQKKLKKGEVEARYTPDGICVLKWHDKRDVIMISSEYTANLEKIKTRSGRDVQKPEMVNKYNNCMCGIDHSDEFLTYYPCERNTIRWHRKIALHIFHVMMNNAYLLHKLNSTTSISLLKFREAVIDRLIYKNRPRLNTIPIPEDKEVHLPAMSGLEGEKKMRKRCRMCFIKGIRKEGLFYCPTCPDKPGLCLNKCFAKYHNYT